MAQYPASNDDREKMTNNNRQAQTFAQRFALVLLAASLMALPFYYYLAAKSDSWQLMTLFYINIPFVIASSRGLWLVRRGRTVLGVCLMLGVMGLVVVAASLLIAGIGGACG